MNFLLSILLFLSFSFSNYNQFNQSFNQPFIDVSKNQTPVIVTIVSEKTEKMNPFFLDPFKGFGFDFDNNFNQEPQERKSQALGSGVIIDKNKGHIITNNHVIEGAEEIKVILFDKREVDAIIIGTDPLSDLAVIKIEADNLKESITGDSNNLQIGEWVIAIGSPFGLHLNHTVTAGIISATGRSDVISRLNFEDFIQHDAAINPGNSGGGLFNLKGELIGINTAIATDGFSKSNAGVGFAIPINQVLRVIDDLINEGKVLRGWLGVQITAIDSDMMKALGLDSKKGALLHEVIKDSPAEKSGLQAKDVIISINNAPIENVNELKNKVSRARPGEILIFGIVRDKIQQTIPVTLGLRPDQGNIAELFSNSSNNQYDLLGLKVEEIPDEEGVIITTIDPKCNAYEKRIREGDVISEIGNEKINNLEKYNLVLQNYKSGDAIMIRIINNGNARYEAFEIN